MSPRRPIPKRPARTSVVLPGDPSDPGGMHRAVTEWLEWLRVHNYRADDGRRPELVSVAVHVLGGTPRRHPAP